MGASDGIEDLDLPFSVVLCDYCGNVAPYVTGREVYPHRRDLYAKRFYQCKPCDAMVGVHPGTDKPLGRLADKALRVAKMAAHAAFDPIWQGGHKRRSGAYAWLAEQLGIQGKDCHIGMFDVYMCMRVVQACNGLIGKRHGRCSRWADESSQRAEGGEMMTNESEVVRYFCAGTMTPSELDGRWVTHADHRALEERYAETVEGSSQLGLQVVELTKELAALRGQYEMVRQCCMDETVRATRLMGDLDDLRKKSDSLVVASATARRELQSCQSVIHLHGGFDPAYVEGAKKAMRDLSAALEAFK